MMARNYTTMSADIDAFVQETEERMLSVARQSLKDTIADAQTPVAKGGRMRVDTGFLRNSGTASVGSWPSGDGKRPADAKPGQYVWDEGSLTRVLAALKLDDTFYWGWVANYARARELHDGFLEAAAQNWRGYVTKNINDLRKRLGK